MFLVLVVMDIAAVRVNVIAWSPGFRCSWCWVRVMDIAAVRVNVIAWSPGFRCSWCWL